MISSKSKSRSDGFVEVVDEVVEFVEFDEVEFAEGCRDSLMIMGYALIGSSLRGMGDGLGTTSMCRGDGGGKLDMKVYIIKKYSVFSIA
jgi:hypothetical protein